MHRPASLFRPWKRIAAILLLLTTWLATTLSSPAWADFRRSYLDGVQAARKGDWDRVIQHMRQAIAGDPNEKSRARLVGAIPEPYLPYFYLGKAHYKKQDCAQVLVTWRISRQQQAIASQPDSAAELERGFTHCQDLVQASADLAKSQSIRNRIQTLRDENPQAWNDALTEQERKAAKHLASADARLAESRAAWRPELATDARRQTSKVSIELTSLLEECGRQLQRHRGQILRAELEAPIASARRLLEEAMQQAPTLALQTSVNQLSDLLNQLDDAKITTADLQNLTRQLPIAVTDLRHLLEASRRNTAVTVSPQQQPARDIRPPPLPPSIATISAKTETRPPASESHASTPPDWLRQAASAFFKGQYKTTLELLDRDDLARRQLFYIHLFRGAARYSIFLLGEKRDPTLRQTAIEDLRACRRLRPAFRPTREYFSPRLIRFYEDHS